MNHNKKGIIGIIEYDQDINYLFKAFLEYYGYQVDGFTKPSDALISFRKKRYDLVLLGLNFHEMDDLTVYKRLKEINDNLSILIVTSDLRAAELLKDIYPESENNIIFEPIALNELKKEVDSILIKSLSQN